MLALLLLGFKTENVVVVSLALSLVLLVYYDYLRASELEGLTGRIAITRESPRIVTELEDVKIRVLVENLSGRDVPLAEVVDHPPEPLVPRSRPEASMVLPKGSIAAFSYSVKPMLPGTYTLRSLEVRVYGPLGFFMTRGTVSSTTTITALPYYGGAKTSLRSLERLWGLVIRGKATGGMYDLADLREYVPGDDRRKIVWKAYARTGRVYVREDFGEVTARVLAMLDVKAWDWTLGEPPNTLASVELRTLRSVVHELARYGVPLDLAVCCGEGIKVVRGATEDLARALADVFSYIEPYCRCAPRVDLFASAPIYMGRSTSDYAAALLITNPVSLAAENPAKFLELATMYGGRLRVVVPRFDYELYVDREELKRIYRVASDLLERTGGTLEFLEESLLVKPIGGTRRWR